MQKREGADLPAQWLRGQTLQALNAGRAGSFSQPASEATAGKRWSSSRTITCHCRAASTGGQTGQSRRAAGRKPIHVLGPAGQGRLVGLAARGPMTTRMLEGSDHQRWKCPALTQPRPWIESEGEPPTRDVCAALRSAGGSGYGQRECCTDRPTCASAPEGRFAP
jgi:hypothetical protein